eukprot:TRINITY_DN15544_c0_g1_i1.p1 TRINITY_DN15544_c0_g1~~TRINITY_DN15544_c0_g1_i1.p1  ORF type:complete len:477 (+),score=115.44 TRINITY_DN15544_c0_g1_i1:101-1432(+)
MAAPVASGALPVPAADAAAPSVVISDAEKQERLAQYCAITAQEPDSSVEILEAAGWDLELAVNVHFNLQAEATDGQLAAPRAEAPGSPTARPPPPLPPDLSSSAKRRRLDDGAAAAGPAAGAAAAATNPAGGVHLSPSPERSADRPERSAGSNVSTCPQRASPVGSGASESGKEQKDLPMPGPSQRQRPLGLAHFDAVLLTREQENRLLAEQERFPRVGDREDLTRLVQEYAACGDPVFVAKTQELPKRYQWMRRTRRDGNCFVRAFLFGFLERCLSRGADGRGDAGRALRSLSEMREALLRRFSAAEDFVQVLEALFRGVRDGSTSEAELLAEFRDGQVSDYAVFGGRFIASHHILEHADQFEPFVGDCKEYCCKQIEIAGTEFEQASIIALATALGVGTRIEYLDRSPGTACNHHDIPENCSPSVFLLYRPGHYDILYPAL